VEPGWQWHRVDGNDVVTHVNNAINNDVEQIVAPDFFVFSIPHWRRACLLIYLLTVIRDAELEMCNVHISY
jgi:hypothetical protein